MQPAASGLDGEGVKLVKGEAVGMEGTVNEEKFWKRRVEDVPVDEVSLYFFSLSSMERMLTMIYSCRCSSIDTLRRRTRGRRVWRRRLRRGR